MRLPASRVSSQSLHRLRRRAREPARARRRRRRAACRSSATPRSSSCCAITRSRSCAAAGLAQQNIQVVIINDRSFNAFVVDGQRIFVNAGALMDSETPNQIIGVLAHETGHIAGGHLAQLRAELANAQTAAIIAHAARRRRDGRRARRRATAPGAAMPAGGDDRRRRRVIQRSLLAYPRRRKSRPTAPASNSSPRPANRPRACTTPSSGSPTRRCSDALHRSLPAVASDADRTRRRARGDRQARAPIGTRRTRRSCRRATT